MVPEPGTTATHLGATGTQPTRSGRLAHLVPAGSLPRRSVTGAWARWYCSLALDALRLILPRPLPLPYQPAVARCAAGARVAAARDSIGRLAVSSRDKAQR